jgi:hypothetical protein
MLGDKLRGFSIMIPFIHRPSRAIGLVASLSGQAASKLISAVA